ncbi:ABC transporter permease [Microbacterium sp.]|uniref:ABC transporter permease n=1 Tax=Microbacterium sp. TaxID=51671 RepID=UPI0037C9A097
MSNTASIASPARVGRSGWSRPFGSTWTALVAWVVMVGLILVALIGPILVTTDPTAQTSDPFLPVGSPGHPLGTDDLGRDVLTRLVYGARPLIGVALASTAIAAVVGTLMGLIAGYARGWTEQAVMRGTDLVLAFPSILLIILLVSMLQPGPTALIIGIAIAMAPNFARLVRALAAREAAKDYTKAAALSGVRTPRMLFAEILPNLTGPLLVQCMTTIAIAAGFSAGMSYIGLGIQPPTADWGYMVQDGQQFIYSAPSLVLLPALLTLMFVVACNFVGDDLRDRFDVRRDL